MTLARRHTFVGAILAVIFVSVALACWTLYTTIHGPARPKFEPNTQELPDGSMKRGMDQR
jgi:hypothetical protein